MVENERGRPFGRLVEPRLQPRGAHVAESATVAAGLEGIEDEDSYRQVIDRILNEAVRSLGLRKGLQQGGAIVVIANRRMDRKGKAGSRFAEGGVGPAVAGILHDVPGGEQQIGPRIHFHQNLEHAVETPAVQFIGNARIEAKMDVTDLGKDHGVARPRRLGSIARGSLSMPHWWHIARGCATGHTGSMAVAPLPPRTTVSAADEGRGDWSPSSWRRFEARQQPDYPDPAALEAAERELADYPPLVAFREIDALRHVLADAQSGRAFLLQGGDCAESFAEFSIANIDANLALLEEMAERVGAGSATPIIRLGRMAGQFAKPRSAASETRGGVSLPAYRGDIVNGIAFDTRARRPDPERMFRAYAQAAATRSRIGPAAYTSHEALLLPFEQALVRSDPDTGRPYATSAHFLWIGDRTRFAGSAHVEFARGLANPIGIKCGPSLDGETLLGLLETLDPAREPGRITLIARMGWDRIEAALPPLLRAVRGSGRPVLWSCDPMHGNTIRTALGSKTRPLDRILAETRAFFAIAAAEGVRCGGLHFEMTGRDVAECIGGGVAPGDPDMADRYHTHCDPRLNPAQAMALADLAAGCLGEAASSPASPRRRSERLPSTPSLG